MRKLRTPDAVAFMALSLVLFNVYRIVHVLPGDLLRSIVVVVCTAGGVVCLVVGAVALIRDRR